MRPFRPFHLAAAALLTLALARCERPEEPEPDPGVQAPAEKRAPADTAPADTPIPVSLPAKVGFNEHIQPILSESCYHCHGPDAETRYPKSEPLRLDLAEHATAPRADGKPVIVPGDPDASELVARIRHTDPEQVMPPPESHKQLSPRQITLLERWVADGAEYQDHWAFLPIERPSPPDSGGDWAARPLDRFIHAKLAERGLEPNPPEDLARFHRRLALDLTGLPPTPAENDAFLAAAAIDPEGAIEDEAERLLATPASAEHFARYWLDAARYADTHGIHIDNYRAIWPYRDWVIRAFQRNLPWDRFTIEQIAGDLLPDPTLEQRVATGFHRCLPTTGEGGAIPEEYEAIYAQDRTNTTAAVWLGLTMGCASCHDHKFDPLTMRDNYAFNAFFRNTTMKAMDGNRADHPPNLFVPLPEDRPRHRELLAAIASVEERLAARRSQAGEAFEAWLPDAATGAGRELDPTLALHLPLDREQGSLHGWVEGEPREWSADLERVDAPFGHAPVLAGARVEFGDLASFARHDQVSFGGFLKIRGYPDGTVISRIDPENQLRGWDLQLLDGRPVVHVIDEWDQSATRIQAAEALPKNRWNHVMVTFDGTLASHQVVRIYINGKRVPANPNPNTVGGRIENSVPLTLGARADGSEPLRKGFAALHDFRFYRRLLPPHEIRSLARRSQLAEILALPADERSEEQRTLLLDHFLQQHDEPTHRLLQELLPLEEELGRIRDRGSLSLVMEEKQDQEPHAHILRRGVYTDRGERVAANTPEALPPLPEDAPRNRLGLARWLVDPANPLPARVTMNRLWGQLFGTGLVETAADFGVMGERPSHPRLLDWLAAEFIDSGWDHRHMVKTLVTSATYRQSAATSPRKLELDPDNRLISRGPRHRLDAEQIRDLALAGSGLLSRQLGGPPVKPYQPEGIWEAVAMPQSNTRNYVADRGENLYRRSIYTFWKRTAPHPAMEILNAPLREVTCVARERTNTPLQAFVTLNDPQFVEASRALADRALAAAPDFDARLDHLSTRLVSRRLDADERATVRDTLDFARAEYEADPESARQLITVGDSTPSPDHDPTELAAWTLVASQLLNLDETLNK